MSYQRNFALIDWSKPIVIETKPPPEYKRSDLPCPQIISDAMPPTQSMADGKIYESKSGIEAATRRAGCVTVGNDKREPFKRMKPSREQIKATVEKAAARYARGERAR